MEVWDWMFGYHPLNMTTLILSGGEGGSERVSVALTGVKAAAGSWGSLNSPITGS